MLSNRVQVTLLAPDGLTADPLTKPMCMLGAEARNRLLRTYPGVRVYVRVLPADQP